MQDESVGSLARVLCVYEASVRERMNNEAISRRWGVFFLKGEVDESEMSAGFFLRAAEVCIWWSWPVVYRLGRAFCLRECDVGWKATAVGHFIQIW